MIKGGKGGGRTVTGLKFEKRVSLKDVLTKLNGYSVEEDIVYFKKNKIAQLLPKYSLYNKLLEPKNIKIKELVSKRLIPDDAILIFSKRTLFIVEIKFQNVGGSVDEKLQTCDFKKRQYTKLLEPLGIDIEYAYVLSDWFKKLEYKDVLQYIILVGCHYFFNELPLKFLGLPEPDK